MREEGLMLPSYCTLDHEGCVTCSDAGIPVRVVSVEGDDALCEDAADNRAQIAVELVAPVRVGEILLTHGGVAIGRVEAEMLKASEGGVLRAEAEGRSVLRSSPEGSVLPTGGRHQ